MNIKNVGVNVPAQAQYQVNAVDAILGFFQWLADAGQGAQIIFGFVVVFGIYFIL